VEAKRLLAHTALPTAVIADRIGFDEATNFIKFFRREVGCSPGEVRRKYTQ
jgi:AraC-like DNA-binding protein